MAEVDSRELSEWVAYHSEEPIGQFRNDLGMATIASTIANCNRASSTAKTYSPTDFMAFGEHRKPNVMDGEDIKAVFMQLAEKGNG